MTRTLSMIVREALNNAEANGYDPLENGVDEFAEDLLDCESEVLKWLVNQIKLEAEHWKMERQSADAKPN